MENEFVLKKTGKAVSGSKYCDNVVGNKPENNKELDEEQKKEHYNNVNVVKDENIGMSKKSHSFCKQGMKVASVVELLFLLDTDTILFLLLQHWTMIAPILKEQFIMLKIAQKQTIVGQKRPRDTWG